MAARCAKKLTVLRDDCKYTVTGLRHPVHWRCDILDLLGEGPAHMFSEFGSWFMAAKSPNFPHPASAARIVPREKRNGSKEATSAHRDGAQKRAGAFDPGSFLMAIAGAKTSREYRAKERIFSQGDIADAVFYIQSGKVKLTVVSTRGKEAVVGILQEGSFFGEGCLAGQPLRMASASAMNSANIFRAQFNTFCRSARPVRWTSASSVRIACRATPAASSVRPS